MTDIHINGLEIHEECFDNSYLPFEYDVYNPSTGSRAAFVTLDDALAFARTVPGRSRDSERDIQYGLPSCGLPTGEEGWPCGEWHGNAVMRHVAFADCEAAKEHAEALRLKRVTDEHEADTANAAATREWLKRQFPD